MIGKISICIFLLAVCQFSKAQVSFQTFHKKNGTEVKKPEDAYFIRVIGYPTEKGNPFTVKEYFTASDSLKLFGAYKDLTRRQFVGPKFQAYENGKIKSKEMYSKDSQLIDTAIYYYQDGKVKIAFNYPYVVDKEDKLKVIDTLILIYRDSLGKTLLTNGNGYAEINNEDYSVTKGHYVNHKKDGEWIGSFSKGRYTYVENYENGHLISGITTDSIGQTYEYNNSNFAVEPQYPGGIERLRQHIGRNFKYPTAAIRDGVSGTINLTFIVEKDGSIGNLEVQNDLGYETGKAAIETLKSTRKWSPGIQRGVPVRVKYSLPIRMNVH